MKLANTDVITKNKLQLHMGGLSFDIFLQYLNMGVITFRNLQVDLVFKWHCKELQ